MTPHDSRRPHNVSAADCGRQHRLGREKKRESARADLRVSGYGIYVKLDISNPPDQSSEIVKVRTGGNVEVVEVLRQSHCQQRWKPPAYNRAQHLLFRREIRNLCRRHLGWRQCWRWCCRRCCHWCCRSSECSSGVGRGDGGGDSSGDGANGPKGGAYQQWIRRRMVHRLLDENTSK